MSTIRRRAARSPNTPPIWPTSSRSLDGIAEINFVAHSLGNLVIRHYLGDQTRPDLGISPDPRIRRIVMLGPPNQGAQVAEAFADNRAVPPRGRTIGRRSWRAAGTSSSRDLATPDCQFGILAGGRGNRRRIQSLVGRRQRHGGQRRDHAAGRRGRFCRAAGAAHADDERRPRAARHVAFSCSTAISRPPPIAIRYCPRPKPSTPPRPLAPARRAGSIKRLLQNCLLLPGRFETSTRRRSPGRRDSA